MIDRETRMWFCNHDLDITGLAQEEADDIRRWWEHDRYQPTAVCIEARKDDDGGRTRIGNTPTCEDCGEDLDHCTCDDDPQPQGETDRYQEMRAKLYMHQHPEATFEEALRIVNSR